MQWFDQSAKDASAGELAHARVVAVYLLLHPQTCRTNVVLPPKRNVKEQANNIFEWLLLRKEYELFFALWALLKHNVWLFRVCRVAANDRVPLLDGSWHSVVDDAVGDGFFSDGAVPDSWLGASYDDNGADVRRLDIFDRFVRRESVDEEVDFVDCNMTAVQRLAQLFYFLACAVDGSPRECGIARASFASLASALPVDLLLRVLRFESSKVWAAPGGGTKRKVNTNASFSTRFNLIRALLGAGKLELLRVMENTAQNVGGIEAYNATFQSVFARSTALDLLVSFDASFAVAVEETFRYLYDRLGDRWLGLASGAAQCTDVQRQCVSLLLYRLLRVGASCKVICLLLSIFSRPIQLKLVNDMDIAEKAKAFAFPDHDSCAYIVDKILTRPQPPPFYRPGRHFSPNRPTPSKSAQCRADSVADIRSSGLLSQSALVSDDTSMDSSDDSDDPRGRCVTCSSNDDDSDRGLHHQSAAADWRTKNSTHLWDFATYKANTC